MAKGKNLVYCGRADGGEHKPLKVEGIAQAATTPATLVVQGASGLSVSSAAATVFGERFLVADKDEARTRSMTDQWAINESMVAIAPKSGDFLNVLVAAGNNITSRGVALTRNGSGLLAIAATDGSEEILCYSDEIINAVANTLVRVYVA